MAINDNVNNNHLQELGGSDFEIAEGQPDIRGWTVKNPQGQTIGEVDELIFDPQSMKVRYLVLDLEGNVLDLESRDVLIPIGLAQLDENDDDVFLPNITADQLRALPKYEKGIFDRDHEHSIRNIFAGAGGAALASTDVTNDADFYTHDYYNEDNLYRNRTGSSEASTTDTTGSIPIIEEELNVSKRVVETGGARLRSLVAHRR